MKSVRREVGEPNKVPVDLIEDGLLWLINKSVFHPRGFALGVYEDDTGNLLFELWGNGDEPWEFAGFDQDGKFQAAEAAFAKARTLPSTTKPTDHCCIKNPTDIYTNVIGKNCGPKLCGKCEASAGPNGYCGPSGCYNYPG